MERAVSLSHQVVALKQPPYRFCRGRLASFFFLPHTPLMWEPLAVGLPFFHLLQLMDLNPAVILFFYFFVTCRCFIFLFCHLSLLLDLNLTIIPDLDQTVTVFFPCNPCRNNCNSYYCWQFILFGINGHYTIHEFWSLYLS